MFIFGVKRPSSSCDNCCWSSICANLFSESHCLQLAVALSFHGVPVAASSILLPPLCLPPPPHSQRKPSRYRILGKSRVIKMPFTACWQKLWDPAAPQGFAVSSCITVFSMGIKPAGWQHFGVSLSSSCWVFFALWLAPHMHTSQNSGKRNVSHWNKQKQRKNSPGPKIKVSVSIIKNVANWTALTLILNMKIHLNISMKQHVQRFVIKLLSKYISGLNVLLLKNPL